MANHRSAEKRARQTIKRTERNRQVLSRVRTQVRKTLEAPADKAVEALSEAFHVIQKAKTVLHRNTIKRKMARLARASARKAKPPVSS